MSLDYTTRNGHLIAGGAYVNLEGVLERLEIRDERRTLRCDDTDPIILVGQAGPN